MIEEFLRKWEELEPKRCVGNSVLIDDNFINIALLDNGDAILEKAIRQAIESHGWYWSLVYGTTSTYTVRIFKPGQTNPNKHLFESFISSINALLTSYLGALGENHEGFVNDLTNE